jgi:amino acid adenylation domain-containing protein
VPTGISELFARAAELRPERRALAVGDERVSYGELLERTLAIQRLLGPRPAAVAGYFDHSVDAVASFLAVLRAGGFYVPLAPVLGAARVAESVRAAGAPVVLTSRALRDELDGVRAQVLATEDAEPAGRRPPEPTAGSSLAYVIFTSGSTGRPKGVAVGHRALAASTRARLALYGSGGTLFLAAPLCFDSSISMFAPLTSGGAVRLSSPGAERDAVRLADEAARDATQLLLLPSVYGELLEVWGARQPPGLRVAIVAGEAASPALVRRHFLVAPARRLVNEYGPTEGTVFCTAHECAPADGTSDSVPIGKAVEGYEVELLDDALLPVAVGSLGEIYIRGAGLAEGYLDDPAATAQAFLPAPGGRRYRTGDLGRLRADGSLEFHGRFDDQVKASGVRVELGEIDRLLETIPEVAEAAAALAGGRIVGCLRLRPGASFDPDAARALLAGTAPTQLVPRELRLVEALPRTASGKVDRRALAREGRPAAPPDARREEDGAVGALLDVCAEVLGERPPADAPFVLYGDSLAAMRVAARLRSRGSELDPAELLDGRPLAETTVLPATRSAAPVGERGRLAPNQLGIWFVEQVAGRTAAFNVPLRFRAHGPLDADAIRHALETLAARHPVLNCRIEMRGPEPLLVPCPEPPDLEVLEVADADDVAAEEAELPIDLRAEPPLRALLVRLPDGRCELLLTFHHIAFDGWSKFVLARDLPAAFRAALGEDVPELLTVPADYLEHAAGLRAADDRGDFLAEAHEAAARLEGYPTLLAFDERPAHAERMLDARGRVVDLSPQVRGGLARLAAAHRTTPFVVLLGGFALALSELTGRERLIVGSVSANRPSTQHEGTIGLFMNVVPIALDLRARKDDPHAVVEHVREQALAAMRFGHVPFNRVVEAVAPERSPDHGPLVQVLFEYFGESAPALNFGSTPVELADDGLQQGAVSDLSIRVFPHGEGLRCVAVRDASVVGEASADALLARSEAAWASLSGVGDGDALMLAD